MNHDWWIKKYEDCKIWRGGTKIDEKERMFNGLKSLVEYLEKNCHLGTMVEIGCFMGQSTDIFASVFSKVYAVDPWDPNSFRWHKKRFGINVEDEFNKVWDNHSNIIKWKSTSEQAASEIPEEFFDFVYIDGNHTEPFVRQDIELWLPRCKWIIGGHDYGITQWCDVKTVVDEMLGKPDVVFDDYSWIKHV